MKRLLWILTIISMMFMISCSGGGGGSSSGGSDDTPTPSSVKAITAFSFTSPAAVGTITESTHSIAITVPSGTNIKALIPAITHTGASINPASGVAQDFTNPVTYTVTAADSTIQTYAVTVILASSKSHLTKVEWDDGNDGTIDGVDYYTYDANGNMAKMELDNNNNGTIDLIYYYTYNANGKLTKRETDWDNNGTDVVD